nr:putative ribonuclease H-like domain-containing protein [Tanacetum cinerariifolium]
NVGYVTFGGNLKGGKITRKGKVSIDATFEVKEPEFEGKKPESEVYVSSSNSAKKHDDKTKREAKGNSPVELLIEYRNLSAEFKDLSNNNIIKVNVASTLVPAIGPTPTTRVHKDHPVTQFISDLSLATQTRSMIRVVKDQGHNQEEGIDYEEVFTPAGRIEAIRLFLANASFIGFMVYQMDVKSAFLYETIKEEVYVCQPPGFEHLIILKKVYKVVKALYGLHQAPRAWYETLANFLQENGFQKGKIDQTLFIKKQKGDILLVQVYVDAIIFGSTNKDLCKAFEKLMKDKFEMSSMGELTLFLGLQVKRKPGGIFISQDKYVAKILKKFDLIDGKSASTPIDTDKPLLKDLDGEDADVHTYRSMIGSLMAGKGFSGLETPLFEGMIVAQQADDVVDEGVAGVDVDAVLASTNEPSIPSPTPTTQPSPRTTFYLTSYTYFASITNCSTIITSTTTTNFITYT